MPPPPPAGRVVVGDGIYAKRVLDEKGPGMEKGPGNDCEEWKRASELHNRRMVI